MRYLLVVLLSILVVGAASSAEIQSYAIVREDGSLRVQGRTIVLHGTYLPRPRAQLSRRFPPATLWQPGSAGPQNQDSGLRALLSADPASGRSATSTATRPWIRPSTSAPG
jgi:hypothetical protein